MGAPGRDWRHTRDVQPVKAASFHDVGIPKRIVNALTQAGYLVPSPIQEKAIPLVRLGVDVMIQAKAGTGKTLVFAVTAAEVIDPRVALPQVLLIAPTREIALQAADTAMDVAPSCGMSVITCIGGLPTTEDERLLRKGCHVVVGTPGRLVSLIERGSLHLGSLAMVVLDEADRLMEDAFYGDVVKIFSAIVPVHNRSSKTMNHSRDGKPQMVALSATFQDANSLSRLGTMLPGRSKSGRESTLFHVYMEDDENKGGISTSLLGVLHYYNTVSKGLSHFMQLEDVFHKVPFRQCIVFCRTKKECVDLTDALKASSYAAGFLSSDIDQLERIRVLNDIRKYIIRILVCTDVASRGIDLPNVDLVCNIGRLPQDASTLAHRIGRAGRFGTRGVAVTMVQDSAEVHNLQRMITAANGSPANNFEEYVPYIEETHNDGVSRASQVCVRHVGKTPLADEVLAQQERSMEVDADFEAHLAAVMEASLWKYQDDMDARQQLLGRKKEIEPHIDLVLQSLSIDIQGEDDRQDSLQILQRAFSKFQPILSEESDASIDGTVYNRHTRSLGSAQSKAMMKRGTGELLLGANRDTITQEADLLERMWDEAMAEEQAVIETNE